MHNVTTLTNYLREQIPISAAMGITVELANIEQVILKAPFIKNINHKKTVFGGSLHAVATLACWSLLFMNLFSENVQIVISKSEVNYLRPVNSDFKAECNKPELAEWTFFLKTLQKKGKARLRLSSKIFQQNHLCVDYSGIFVAIQTSKEKDGLETI